jgi:hypothetical protein
MPSAQIGTQVNTELCSRLRIGGVWYTSGQTVQLDQRDVELYEARGFSKRPKPGAKAANVEEPVALKAGEVGIQLKADPDSVPTSTFSKGGADVTLRKRR